MASILLRSRDEFYATVSASGWTKYTDIVNMTKEVIAFPCTICTFADQDILLKTSRNIPLISTVELLFLMLVRVDDYATLTAAYEVLFLQYETWLNSGTLKADYNVAKIFHNVIGNKPIAGIEINIKVRVSQT